MNCSLIIKATKVDGIYNKDPLKYKEANFEGISKNDIFGE